MMAKLVHPLITLSFLVFCMSVLIPAQLSAQPTTLKLYGLQAEYKENPVGIDARKPRLSWKIQSDARDVMQAAYQIKVARNPDDLTAERGLLWDSGRVKSEESVNRIYDGPGVESRQRYYWQVRVWDNSGKDSGWSAPVFWEMGLLQPSDWKASWIEPGSTEDSPQLGPAPMLRAAFKLNGAVSRARAYVTARGLYEFHLNGHRVGDQVLTPGWTSYNKRIQYQTYDVTNLVKNGVNAAGALLGNGWFRGQISRNVYTGKIGFLMQINVTYSDGREETIITDQKWKSSTGPILMSDIYQGETYDARLEKTDWAMPGFDDSQWAAVTISSDQKANLVAPAGPPVRRTEEIKPIKILKTPGGDTVVDMGQNMVGWLRLKVEGPAGTTVTLRHAEVLDKEGNFYTENLRKAKQTIQYTLKGGGIETFEPHFTFQGFRYVAVDGYPGTLTLDSLTGVVVHSDMAKSGEFETSVPLINQLQHNIVWGQNGNFVDVPTDCPQRDERLGWTGDAQVFARTAAFNRDVAGFFTKWLKDLAADQLENGSVPHVIPDILSRPGRPSAGSAAWADSAVIIPWTMYLVYGDKQFLEDQYPSMTKWVEYMRQRAGDDYIWDGDDHFGDWLAFATTRSDYPGATTGKDYIATCFFAHSTDLLARVARILGRQDDAVRYENLLSKIKEAYRREFVTDNGRVAENTQTAYVLALEFDLLPENLRPVAAKRLAADVRERKHLTTGFVGTPYLCHVLTRYGYLDEAYLLLTRQDYPSWLYPVKQGATTIWERWDGQKPDGSFQDKGMNSFNHYAYGAIGDWMYRVMAGIEIDSATPGYKHILIQPQPGGGFETMYGKLSSAWSLKDGKFALAVQIPANTRATIRLPRAKSSDVTESGKPLVQGRQDGDAVSVEVGSGSYQFEYPMQK
jgi:alpha-L-rhamnosidase